jgi:hypothetical protein
MNFAISLNGSASDLNGIRASAASSSNSFALFFAPLPPRRRWTEWVEFAYLQQKGYDASPCKESMEIILASGSIAQELNLQSPFFPVGIF